VGEVEFSNNRLVGMMLKVVVEASDGSRRGPFTFFNNTSDTPHGALAPMMRFVRVDGVVVEGNVQPMVVARQMTAVHAVESCEITVRDNAFSGAAEEVIVVPFGCPAVDNRIAQSIS
jgi:hypothetical protein